MKRKRRVWYEVSTKDMYWGGKKIGWVDNPYSPYNGYAFPRSFNKANKAFSHAITLPAKTIVTKWCIKNGIKFATDYIL